MVVGVWVMCCFGILYFYFDYFIVIKEMFYYDQEMLDMVGFFKEFGEFVGFVLGFFYDVFFMWVVFFIGVI